MMLRGTVGLVVDYEFTDDDRLTKRIVMSAAALASALIAFERVRDVCTDAVQDLIDRAADISFDHAAIRNGMAVSESRLDQVMALRRDVADLAAQGSIHRNDPGNTDAYVVEPRLSAAPRVAGHGLISAEDAAYCSGKLIEWLDDTQRRFTIEAATRASDLRGLLAMLPGTAAENMCQQLDRFLDQYS